MNTDEPISLGDSGLSETGGSLRKLGLFAAPPHPGTLGCLGKYVLLRELGSGGMGVVYLAFHCETHQQAAIKVIKPELNRNDRITRQFIRECRLLQELYLANSTLAMVPILEFGEIGGLPYCVMQYMKGGTLNDRMKRGRDFSPAEILAVAIPVAETMEYAYHTKSFVHRDIKPANILINQDGNPCLGDFGLMRSVLTDDASLSVEECNFAGTPAYMAPEVASSQAGDTRCDIYSIGAVMYQMATGRPPYTGHSAMHILSKVLAGPPEELRKANPQQPKELARIIGKAMAPDLAQRYASMSHLLKDLRHYALVLKTRTSSRPADESSASLRRWLFAGAGVVAAAIFTLTFLSSPSKAPLTPESQKANAPVAEKKSQPAPTATEVGVKQTPDAALPVGQNKIEAPPPPNPGVRMLAPLTNEEFANAPKTGTAKWEVTSEDISVYSWTYGNPGVVLLASPGSNQTIEGTLKMGGLGPHGYQGIAVGVPDFEQNKHLSTDVVMARLMQGRIELVDRLPLKWDLLAKSEPVEIKEGEKFVLKLCLRQAKQVTVYLNGKLMVTYETQKPLSGHLALVAANGNFRFSQVKFESEQGDAVPSSLASDEMEARHPTDPNPPFPITKKGDGRPENTTVPPVVSNLTKRYEVVEKGLSWRDAVAACKARGGHLVRIESMAENELIFSLIKAGTADGYWLDATNSGHEGNWMNSEGQKLAFTNWGQGQPDNYAGVEHWARIRRTGATYYRGAMNVKPGNWEDWDDSKLPYICEWNDAPKKAPAGSREKLVQSGHE